MLGRNLYNTPGNKTCNSLSELRKQTNAIEEKKAEILKKYEPNDTYEREVEKYKKHMEKQKKEERQNIGKHLKKWNSYDSDGETLNKIMCYHPYLEARKIYDKILEDREKERLEILRINNAKYVLYEDSRHIGFYDDLLEIGKKMNKSCFRARQIYLIRSSNFPEEDKNLYWIDEDETDDCKYLFDECYCDFLHRLTSNENNKCIYCKK